MALAFRPLFAALAVFGPQSFGGPPQDQLGTIQIVGHSGQSAAMVNGAKFTFAAPPIELGGKTYVPLIETLAAFGVPLQRSGVDLVFGHATLGGALDHAELSGTHIPTGEIAQRRGDVLFVTAKFLAEAVDGRISSGVGGEFYLTVVRQPGNRNLLPQPRFATDKSTYAIGEPVRVEEFSFDPLGAAFNLTWTNLHPAYFRSGKATITLEATNVAKQGNRLAKTIQITSEVANTPLQYALKFGEIGTTFSDNSLVYPVAARLSPSDNGGKLIVSDSPERFDRMGALFRTSFVGDARLLAYHQNGTNSDANVGVLVKNLGSTPTDLMIRRLGETAPAVTEGVLGQVTLLDFFSDRVGSRLHLLPGEIAAVYLSPRLSPQSGVSLLADLHCDNSVELCVAALVGETLPSPESAFALNLLPTDRNHVRGVFPTSQRTFSLDLQGSLPQKVVIGDRDQDSPAVGQDPANGQRVVLDGNYGITYAITLTHASGVVAALAPRGGVYKGVIVVQDLTSGREEIVRLPREGVLTSSSEPIIFLRSTSPTVRLQLIPASGSQLPVHLIFYRP